MKNVLVPIDDTLHIRLKVKCAERQVTVKQTVKTLIEKWVEDTGPEILGKIVKE